MGLQSNPWGSGPLGALEVVQAITEGGRITDGFSGTNGETTANRLPDTNNNGAEWSTYNSTSSIQGNAVRFDAPGAGIAIQFGIPEQDITFIFTPDAVAGTEDNRIAFRFRSDLGGGGATATGYNFQFRTGSNSIRLGEQTAGVNTNLAVNDTFTINAATEYTVRVRIEDAPNPADGYRIRAAVNGTQVFDVTNAAHATGSYVQVEHLTFTDNTLRLTSIDVQDPATVSWQLGAHTMQADARAFTLTGQAVTTLYDRVLPAAAGGYTLTGQAVTTRPGFQMSAEAGAFTLSGQEVATLDTGDASPVVGETVTRTITIRGVREPRRVEYRFGGRVFYDR